MGNERGWKGGLAERRSGRREVEDEEWVTGRRRMRSGSLGGGGRRGRALPL
jgi:hypothetical protein